MKHYSLEQWVDFARDVAKDKERVAMQAHLDEGCEECSKSADLLRRVHNVARREHSHEPSDSSVRMAKGTFGIHGPRKARGGGTAIIELLFDSSRAAVPVGVRSTAAAARQLLYGVGEFRVDVRIEPHGNSGGVSVIGQVLDFANRGAGLLEVPVALVGNRKILGESTTNEFGEFHLECDRESGFQLRVKLPSKEVNLAVAHPSAKAPAGATERKDSKTVRGFLKRTRAGTKRKS
jgi:hypothetical protein